LAAISASIVTTCQELESLTAAVAERLVAESKRGDQR